MRATLRTTFLRVTFFRTAFFRTALRTAGRRVAFRRDTFFRVAFLRLDFFSTGRAGGGASSSSVMPNRSERSSPNRSSSAPAAAAAGSASVDTRSVGSTPRRRNNCSGSESSRTPTPYRTAATCLHMAAQSGQEQPSSISFGVGNSPSPGRVTISMTRRGGFPSSNSTSDSISPAHSRRMDSQCSSGTGSMRIATS